MLDPDSVWPFSRGAGVTVAVLSSGVDASAPQLAGHVLPGADFLHGGGTAPANTDCAGLGTQVAGVIAAQPSAAVGFHGLAPETKILPITVSDNDEVAGNDASTAVDLGTYAAAIRFAVSQHASVLALSAVSYTDDSRLRAAVADALAADVVVVASAGTTGTGDAANRVPYPAAYDGVLGVGAIREDGSLAPGSPAGTFVDLVAPGTDVVSTQRSTGLVAVDGAGVATGFVAAVAALVRARGPALTAAQVVQRLLATATPASGGPDIPGYGQGIPNPYQAVTERMLAAPAQAMPSFAANPPDTQQLARKAAWSASRTRAIGLAAVGLLVVLGIVLAALAIPRGRRHRWRPTFAPRPEEQPEAELPSPPVGLFDDR
jgi:membrane-anchored mycosin MYCP